MATLCKDAERSFSHEEFDSFEKVKEEVFNIFVKVFGSDFVLKSDSLNDKFITELAKMQWNIIKSLKNGKSKTEIKTANF